jgi:DNA-binding response OmpR family regulator
MAPLNDKKTVVIFEDSLGTQELLSFFFAKQGFRTRTYGDGADAAARVREHAPVLIMMDLLMPGRDGLQACADIRLAGIATPIVFLTGKAREEDRARALSAGATAYLVKPFRPGELEAAVKPLLNPGQ